MTAIASLLIVLTLSLLVTRIATMAFMLTGMSRESAKFQARSAFTGVGYTTREAEEVVRHPVRRRIAMVLMMLGNLGIGAVIATLMLSLMNTTGSEDWWLKLMVLVVSSFLLWRAASSRYLERHLNRVIARLLKRWGKMQARDHVAILQLEGGYAVSELLVEPGDWLADQTLIQLNLPSEGVLVLGIRRSEGTYLGTPTGSMTVRPGDTLVIYGPAGRIEDLDRRRRGRRGESARKDAVQEYHEDLAEQLEADVKIDHQRTAQQSS